MKFCSSCYNFWEAVVKLRHFSIVKIGMFTLLFIFKPIMYYYCHNFYLIVICCFVIVIFTINIFIDFFIIIIIFLEQSLLVRRNVATQLHLLVPNLWNVTRSPLKGPQAARCPSTGIFTTLKLTSAPSMWAAEEMA